MNTENGNNTNDTLDKPISYNKWELLYQYAIKALDQDIERFHKLDDKISKFITTVTIIIGVFVATVPFVFKNHFPPKSPDEWVLMCLIFFSFLSLCSVWGYLLMALKLVNVPRMPLNREVVELFKTNQKINNIFYALTKTCQNAFEQNKSVNAQKVKFLNKAYRNTVYAALLIVAVLFWIALLQLTR